MIPKLAISTEYHANIEHKAEIIAYLLSIGQILTDSHFAPFPAKFGEKFFSVF